MTNASLDDQITAFKMIMRGDPIDDDILATLRSVRDAGKALPVEPETPPDGWPINPYTRQWMRYAFELRAHAVADRARVKEVERERDRHMGAVQAYIEDANAMKKRADSAGAELNTLKAKLREEPSIETLREMAYQLRLVPRGETVHVDFLHVLKRQYMAAMTAAIGEK